MDNFYCSWDEPTLIENMWNIWDCMTRYRNEVGMEIYTNPPLVIVGRECGIPLHDWDRRGIWLENATFIKEEDTVRHIIWDNGAWMGDWGSAYTFSLLCKLELHHDDVWNELPLDWLGDHNIPITIGNIKDD